MSTVPMSIAAPEQLTITTVNLPAAASSPELSPSSQEALMALLLPELDSAEVTTLLNSPTMNTPDYDTLLPLESEDFTLSDEDLAQLIRQLEAHPFAAAFEVGGADMEMCDAGLEFDFDTTDLTKYLSCDGGITEEDASMFFADAAAAAWGGCGTGFYGAMTQDVQAEDALFMEIIQN